MRTLGDRFDELRSLLKQHEIRLGFIPARNSKRFRGFITFHPVKRWVLWLNESLDRTAWAWIVAHELGHFFSRQQLELWSPLDSWDPDQPDAISEAVKDWGSSRKRKQDERAASAWAADFLVTDQEWRLSERTHPSDLRQMAHWLEAPVEALYVRSQRIQDDKRLFESACQLHISDAAAAHLLAPRAEKPGGIQDFLPTLASYLEGRKLSLPYRQFVRVRYFQARYGNKGGFRGRARELIDCLAQAIQKSHCLHCFFHRKCMDLAG